MDRLARSLLHLGSMPPRHAAARSLGTPEDAAYVDDAACPLLCEQVVLDALTARIEPCLARTIFDVAVAERGVPRDPSDVRSIGVYLRGPLLASLVEQLGRDSAHAVVGAAEALLFGLKPERMLHAVPPFRGPFILVSARESAFEKVLDLRRVTNAIDLLLETEAAPRATIVVDAWTSPVGLVTIAAMASELPTTAQIVVVGASDEDRETFRVLSGRGVTFTDVYEPLSIVRRAPKKSEPVVAALPAAPSKKPKKSHRAKRVRQARPKLSGCVPRGRHV